MFRKLRRIAKEWRVSVYNACFNRPIGYIYMFHMVRPKEDFIEPIDELRVSPEFFETFLRQKQKQLDFISIDDIYSHMGDKHGRNKPFGIITFDDGYADNHIFAYPILKKFNIPFTIYISAGLVNEDERVWNYPFIIERVVQKNCELNVNGTHYNCRTMDEKKCTFIQLKSLLFSLPYNHLHEEFRRLFAEYLDDSVFPNNTLSWEQIEELSKDPLCTIGSHTMTHCRLTISDEPSLEFELGQSKKLLESHTGKQIKHLSYPYGWKTDVSPEAKFYAKQIGYQTALISWGGAIRQSDCDLYALKRIMVHE